MYSIINEVQQLIGSGLLELYVLGAAAETKCNLIEKMALQYPQISEEIDSIIQFLERLAEKDAVKPDDTLMGRIWPAD